MRRQRPTRQTPAGAPIELEFARGHDPWAFGSVERWVSFMQTRYGPMLKARESEGRRAQCRAEIAAMAARRNEATDGRLLMAAEYLVAVGRKTAA